MIILLILLTLSQASTHQWLLYSDMCITLTHNYTISDDSTLGPTQLGGTLLYVNESNHSWSTCDNSTCEFPLIYPMETCVNIFCNMMMNSVFAYLY